MTTNQVWVEDHGDGLRVARGAGTHLAGGEGDGCQKICAVCNVHFMCAYLCMCTNEQVYRYLLVGGVKLGTCCISHHAAGYSRNSLKEQRGGVRKKE